MKLFVEPERQLREQADVFEDTAENICREAWFTFKPRDSRPEMQQVGRADLVALVQWQHTVEDLKFKVENTPT